MVILLLGACTFGAVFVAVKATKDTQVSTSGALMNKEGSRMLSTVAQGTRFQLFNNSEDTPLCVSTINQFTVAAHHHSPFLTSNMSFYQHQYDCRLRAKPLMLSKAMCFKGQRLFSMLKRKASINAPSSLWMLPPRSPQVVSHVSALRMERNTALLMLSQASARRRTPLDPRDVVS